MRCSLFLNYFRQKSTKEGKEDTRTELRNCTVSSAPPLPPLHNTATRRPFAPALAHVAAAAAFARAAATPVKQESS